MKLGAYFVTLLPQIHQLY